MIDHYDSGISFSDSKRKNESQLCYSSALSVQELADYIRCRNVCHEAGILLRQAFDLIDFKLDDSFCDADELMRAWLNTPMPVPYLSLVSSLCKIKKARLMKLESQNMHFCLDL